MRASCGHSGLLVCLSTIFFRGGPTLLLFQKFVVAFFNFYLLAFYIITKDLVLSFELGTAGPPNSLNFFYSLFKVFFTKLGLFKLQNSLFSYSIFSSENAFRPPNPKRSSTTARWETKSNARAPSFRFHPCVTGTSICHNHCCHCHKHCRRRPLQMDGETDLA